MRARALALGFDRVGFCDATLPDDARHFTAWLEAGHHAGMEWLERGAARRLDPQKVLKGARSFVIVALSYAPPDLPPLAGEEPPGPIGSAAGLAREDSPLGFVARYARGDDYHEVMGDRLSRLEEFIETEAPGHRALAYVDTGPFLERMWAARAGIGWIGKNALVLNETMGSFFLLGLVVTTAALPADSPATDRCGGCARCLDACPTGAIVAPRVVDSRRCVSYQTIELRGPIPLGDRASIGTRLFGCDDCQEACPYNHSPEKDIAPAGRSPRRCATPPGAAPPEGGLLGRRPEAAEASLASLLEMTREAYRERFRHTAIKRATFEGLRRNAALALGHAAAGLPPGSPRRAEAAGLLARRAADVREDPIVREHAAWALGILEEKKPRGGE